MLGSVMLMVSLRYRLNHFDHAVDLYLESAEERLWPQAASAFSPRLKQALTIPQQAKPNEARHAGEPDGGS